MCVVHEYYYDIFIWTMTYLSGSINKYYSTYCILIVFMAKYKFFLWKIAFNRKK